MWSRRAFLGAAAGAAALAAKKPSGLKIGVMDGVLGQSSKAEAVSVAKSLGLEGLQVTLGRTPEGGLLLEDAALQSAIAGESKRHGLPIDATYIDILHANCLKNDAKAPGLIRKGIEITKNLNAPILMTVFFGKCAVLNRAELLYTSDLFRELAPEAERAGVILGFENVLKAEDNIRAFDRVASKAFKIYYDVGNSTNVVGVDAPQEIRQLGRDRICQFHFKDKGYLGEGKVDFTAVLAAAADIGFHGFANLETNSPSGVMADDLKKNLSYLRGLLA